MQVITEKISEYAMIATALRNEAVNANKYRKRFLAILG